MSDQPLGESLAALSRFFIGDLTVHETLQQISELVIVAVASADMVGLTMLIEGRARTAVFTDDAAPEIDRAQYDTGEGPCLDAFRDQAVYVIADTHSEGPWPAFRAVAAEHGVRSTLSLPMGSAGRSLGAMNLYSRVREGFSIDDRKHALLFASQASIVLTNAQTYWDARDLSDRLGDAMEHRAVIEQAKGMLMATQRCNEDEAFELLVKASQRENLKLRDIAQRIVLDAINRGQDGGRTTTNEAAP